MDRRRMMSGFRADDRISNLPGSVIDHILDYLPFRQAVRTSILSKEWRHKWLGISNLVFDEEFTLLLPENCLPDSVIYHVLLLHKGSIAKFLLRGTCITNGCAVDHWLHFLSNHRVEDLEVCLYSLLPDYVIPHYLFSFEHLKRLHLEDVGIRCPLVFNGFNQLVRLNLVNVKNALKELKALTSKCPMLEFLNIEHDVDLAALCVGFDLPNLKSLHFTGIFSSILLESLSLEDLSIDYPFYTILANKTVVDLNFLESNSSGCNFVKTFGNLSSIKKLTCNAFFLQFLAIGGVPRKLAHDLNHLTAIQFSTFKFGHMDVISCALCLIRSSPNLRDLEMTSETSDYFENLGTVNYVMAQQHSRPPLNCSLAHVIIKRFAGLILEMEFVKLLLLGAVALRKLDIRFDQFGTDEDAFRVLKQLATFRRRSSKAVVIFD